MTYPWTVHDLWLALTRLPPHLQNAPIGLQAGEEFYNLDRLQESNGTDHTVTLTLSDFSEAPCDHEDHVAARTDILEILDAFENDTLNSEPPPPPIPLVDDVRELLTEIRDRYEQLE